jgi:DNA mismatch repair protein MutH
MEANAALRAFQINARSASLAATRVSVAPLVPQMSMTWRRNSPDSTEGPSSSTISAAPQSG